MTLERELETYRRERPGWVAAGKVGQWVVIHEDDILGFFPSLDAALQAGYDRFGLDELFMAREVTEVDHPIPTSRRAVHVDRKP